MPSLPSVVVMLLFSVLNSRVSLPLPKQNRKPSTIAACTKNERVADRHISLGASHWINLAR
jgi:hypothetical protein